MLGGQRGGLADDPRHALAADPAAADVRERESPRTERRAPRRSRSKCETNTLTKSGLICTSRMPASVFASGIRKRAPSGSCSRTSSRRWSAAPKNERGGYIWRGELRLWDSHVLMGYYAAADSNVRSKGVIFFILHTQDQYAHGRWVGLSYDGPVISGAATLAQTKNKRKPP